MTGTPAPRPSGVALTIRLLHGFSVVSDGTVIPDADLASRRARTCSSCWLSSTAIG